MSVRTIRAAWSCSTLFSAVALAHAGGFLQQAGVAPQQPAAEAPAPRLDAELLLGHPALVPGDDARVRADILAALESAPDAPLAIEALHVLDWHAEGLTADEVVRLAALAAKVSDGEAVFHARRIAERERQRLRYAAAPLPRDLVPRGGALRGWEVVGPFGPLDHRAPHALAAPPGSPEPAPNAQDFGFETEYVASDGAPRRWVPCAAVDEPDGAVVPGEYVYPGHGVAYARVFVRGFDEPQRVILEVRTSGAFRAYWNGAFVHDEPRTSPSAVGERFLAEVELAAGWNALLVRLTTEEEQPLSARLLDLSGRELAPAVPRADAGHPHTVRWSPSAELPVPLRTERLGAEGHAGPYAAALAAARALIARRPDLALAVPEPEGDPRGLAAWRLVRLRALNAAQHVPDEVERRMTVALLDALEADGPHFGLARAARIRQLQREDRPLDALARAEEWIAAAPDLALPRLARAACLGLIDKEGVLRRLALEEVVLAHPHHAGAHLALADARRADGDEVGAASEAWLALSGDAESDRAFDLVLEFARRAGDVARLTELLQRERQEVGAGPPRDPRLFALAEELDDELFVALHQAACDVNRAQPDLWWRVGDLHLRRGKELLALGAFRAELSADPSDSTTRETLRLLGEPDPVEAFFAEFAPDVDAALVRAATVTDASVVDVLDSGLVYFFADGASHARFQTLSVPRDRKGTEALHVHPLEDDTRVARIRTKDGRELEPVEVDGEWTLPSLEPGDVVEFVWDIQAPGVPGTAPVERGWRFSSFEKAFPTSRWVLFVPDGLPGRLDVRNFEGTHEQLPREGGTVHVLTASSPRLVEEPLRPSDLEVLPIAAYAGDRTRDDELAAWDKNLAVLTELPADLEAEVGAFAAAHRGADVRATAEALYHALDERIRDQRGGFRAADVWWQERGLPLFLLAAAYERAGVPFEFAVLERGVSPELDPEPVVAFANQRPLDRVGLRLGLVDGAGEPVWVIASGEPGFPFGVVPPAMAGAPAFVRGPAGWRQEELPRSMLEASWDADVELRYTLADDGAAAVTGRFVVSTAQGDVLRRQLREATAQQREGFARRQVNSVVRGLDVESATFELDSAEPGLLLVFSGRLPRYLTARPAEAGSAAEYTADPPFLPLGLDQGLGPAERKWPLVFRSSLRIRVRATLELGASWVLLGGPNPTQESRAGLTVDLELDSASDPTRGVLEQRVVRRGAVVAPSEMLAFLARMGELEAEFRRPLRLARRP